MKTQQNRRDFVKFAAAAIAAPFVQPKPSSGRISTLAGTGVQGLAANGDLADHATLNNPFGIVIGPDGALYWVEYGSHRLLRAAIVSCVWTCEARRSQYLQVREQRDIPAMAARR